MHVLIPTNAAPGSSRGCGQTSVNCGDQANWASDATMQCMLQFKVSLLRLYLPGLKGIGVFNPLTITLHAALQYELCNASCDNLHYHSPKYPKPATKMYNPNADVQSQKCTSATVCRGRLQRALASRLSIACMMVAAAHPPSAYCIICTYRATSSNGIRARKSSRGPLAVICKDTA
jgi:hypothetical protein